MTHLWSSIFGSIPTAGGRTNLTAWVPALAVYIWLYIGRRARLPRSHCFGSSPSALVPFPWEGSLAWKWGSLLLLVLCSERLEDGGAGNKWGLAGLGSVPRVTAKSSRHSSMCWVERDTHEPLRCCILLAPRAPCGWRMVGVEARVSFCDTLIFILQSLMMRIKASFSVYSSNTHYLHSSYLHPCCSPFGKRSEQLTGRLELPQISSL